MTVGILTLELFIPQSNSLKEKRMVMHSLKARLRNRFNVAIAQTGSLDKWQKAELAVVGVENDRKVVNSTLSEVLNFIETSEDVSVISHDLELM